MRKLLIAAGCFIPAALFAMGSSSAIAQQQDEWKQVGGPEGSPTVPVECRPADLASRHAYWTCTSSCKGQNAGTGYCWTAVSYAYYVCTGDSKQKDYSGKNISKDGFRRLEYALYTNKPCGPQDWATAVKAAETWGEPPTKDEGPKVQPATKPTLPTTDEGLPPNTDDAHKPSWGGGLPPWAPKEDTDKKDSSETDKTKTDSHKTDQNKTDGTKTDQSKTDQRKTGQEKPDQGKTAPGKTDQSKTEPGKSDSGKSDQGKSAMPRNQGENIARRAEQGATVEKRAPSAMRAEAERTTANASREHTAEHDALRSHASSTTPDWRNEAGHVSEFARSAARTSDSGGTRMGALAGARMHGFGAERENGFGARRMEGFGGMREGGFGGMHMGGFGGGFARLGGFFR